ncbi:MAG: D-tyrosyl-tRNA(Tyr) deacylase [Phycisphaerae bacterium]|nr:D-tyrosyl-tRNA(Tyr) deacylase [Phycisphaerae bacterium]
MIAVVQRVSRASVTVADEVVGRVGVGLCVLVGVEVGDGPNEATRLAEKLAKLRIFGDDAGKMNRSVRDVGGGMLLVSQFTLAADTSEGNRPSFTRAAPPVVARPLFESIVATLRGFGIPTETGRFREHMAVSIENDGPVTIILCP